MLTSVFADDTNKQNNTSVRQILIIPIVLTKKSLTNALKQKIRFQEKRIRKDQPFMHLTTALKQKMVLTSSTSYYSLSINI